jgi:glycosyltransferase involved in cell wall biosynthesis
VHVHWWFPAGLALLGDVRPDDPPMMITMHGSDIRLAERKTIIHPVLRRVFRQAAMRTAVSSWLRDLALQMAPDGDIVVAPMPVDTRLLMDAPVPGKREGLLFVGRLNAQKGLTDLLSALALPPLSGVVLHVVGDGADREALKQQALHLGIASRVHWHGQLPQPALIPRYRAARAVVMPSRGEGLGLVAVEAQLCGTPVVAYDNGGVVDVVRPDFGGTLAPTGDVAALAAAIAHVIVSDEQVQHLGQAAREDMLARFTPQAVASRYLELYDQARSSRSGQAGGASIDPQGRP